MDKAGKIINIESDEDSDKDATSKPSENECSNVLVYERDQLLKFSAVKDLPENFEELVERCRENGSEIIFPCVPREEEPEDEDDHDEYRSDFGVIEVLERMEDANLEDQIVKFQKLVDMTEEQLEAMKDVSDALEKVLKSEFPDCKAFPFGSSASGLGFRDSDLDIHVELGVNAKDESFYVKVGMWGDKFRTRKVCDILKRAERFKSAVPVVNARTPIIRLKERRTSIKCDINVVSSMGVKNTEYLAFCNEQDTRFLPLVSILKYFCRMQEITSSGKGDHLNSYTLVLMVIFFLQSKNILHSVEALQKGVEEEEVDGWNFALNREKSQLPHTQLNRSSVSRLLLQFFKFYIDFPYDSHVICPLVGQFVKRYNIKQGVFLPAVLESAPFFGRKREKLEVTKVFVVQDPFELTRNVGQAVSRSRLEHMLKEFSTADRLLSDLKSGENRKAKFWMLFEAGMSTYRDILATQFVPIYEEPLRFAGGGLHLRGQEEDLGEVAGNNHHKDQLDDNPLEETPHGEQDKAKPVTDFAEDAKTNDIHEDRPLDKLKVSDENPAEDSVCVSVPGRAPPQPRPRSALEVARQVLFHQQSLRFPPPRL